MLSAIFRWPTNSAKVRGRRAASSSRSGPPPDASAATARAGSCASSSSSCFLRAMVAAWWVRLAAPQRRQRPADIVGDGFLLVHLLEQRIELRGLVAEQPERPMALAQRSDRRG